MSAVAYLPDLSFSQSFVQPMVVQLIIGQPVVSQPVVRQLTLGQPGAGQSSVDQPSGPIPPLLSLWLQPDLNVLAQTSLPKLFSTSTLVSRSAGPYQIKV